MMKPPATLHGRLYLLSFDRHRQRFGGCDPTVLDLAVRAAKVADLYLSGHLVDRGGRPYPGRAQGPGDPVLNREVAQFGVRIRVRWDEAITRSYEPTTRVVRDQLEAGGWLLPRAHQTGTCLEPRNDELVAALVQDVGRTLQRAVAGDPVNQRTLTLGLIATLAGFSSLSTVRRAAFGSPRFTELVDEAGPPVQALSRTLDTYFAQPGPVEDTDTCGGDDDGVAIVR